MSKILNRNSIPSMPDTSNRQNPRAAAWQIALSVFLFIIILVNLGIIMYQSSQIDSLRNENISLVATVTANNLEIQELQTRQAELEKLLTPTPKP